jgi:exopolyphosphatase / guanosine-5'-triphosphate,3'-diphosphate pyrophosphatase
MPEAQRVAAIDCGTNSIRLLIADIDAASRTAVDVVRRMEIVRLGQGVDRTGELAPAAIERTRVALADFADQIRRLEAGSVRMVATSASRDARNADDFRAMVRDTLGAEPEVITGDEEARLSFTGAVRGLGAGYRPPYLVVDIGGGSTEFVSGDQSVEKAISVDIGCVRMTERHLRSDPPTAAEIEAATADIAYQVGRALKAVPPQAGHTLVGLAGSVTTVALIAIGAAEYDPELSQGARVSYAQVKRVTDDLLAATREVRSRMGVMHPGRVDVIGAGALVLRTVMELSGSSSVVASEHDILDGIAWSQVLAS